MNTWCWLWFSTMKKGAYHWSAVHALPLWVALLVLIFFADFVDRDDWDQPKMTRAWSLSHPSHKELRQINETRLLYSRAEWKVKNCKLQCNFQQQITNHVTVLISEQFLKSWLDHVPLAKWARQSSKFLISTTSFGTDSQSQIFVLGTGSTFTKIWDLFWNQDCDLVNW